MWLIHVTCSDPACEDEFEAVVEELGEIERLACACEHGVVVVSVSHFEPLHLAAAA